MQDSIFDEENFNNLGEKVGDYQVQIELDENAADWYVL